MIMACVPTLMVIQSFLSIIADALDCVATTHRQVIADWACQPFESKDITNVPYHHCSMTCIHDYECQAFIYDKIRQSCMMLSKPCVWLQPHTSHIYGIRKRPCFSWENHDTDYPFYWCYEGTQRTYIGRRLHRGDMVVGKVTVDFYSVDPNAFSFISGGYFDTLMVDPSCEVTWVPHDANSGQPLPDDALIGGVLSKTNTPLYVARQRQGSIHIISYYNPLNNQAWGTHWSAGPLVLNRMVFEVMTVTRPQQNWLAN